MIKMLRILSNPKIKSFHSESLKIIVAILEMFSIQDPFDFLCLITEIILTLEGNIKLFFFSIF
jgi:hypothetical protein